VEFVKCPKCKRPILDRARVCPGCNTPLRAGTEGGARESTGGRGAAIGGILLAGSAAVALVAHLRGWKPTFRSAPRPELPPMATPAVRQDTKYGLTEAERRSVYQDVLGAEDRSELEADRRYPAPDPAASTERWQRRAETREQFLRQADEEDKKSIAKRYGLTSEQLAAIAEEGVQQSWPRPPHRSLR
jgi:hypothetical protein